MHTYKTVHNKYYYFKQLYNSNAQEQLCKQCKSKEMFNNEKYTQFDLIFNQQKKLICA